MKKGRGLDPNSLPSVSLACAPRKSLINDLHNYVNNMSESPAGRTAKEAFHLKGLEHKIEIINSLRKKPTMERF